MIENIWEFYFTFNLQPIVKTCHVVLGQLMPTLPTLWKEISSQYIVCDSNYVIQLCNLLVHGTFQLISRTGLNFNIVRTSSTVQIQIIWGKRDGTPNEWSPSSKIYVSGLEKPQLKIIHFNDDNTKGFKWYRYEPGPAILWN